MSEWFPVLGVFWLLWVWDGVRVRSHREHHVVGDGRRHRGRLDFGRVAVIGAWPGNWWMHSADVPLSLSPEGVCNRAVGCVGRPAEQPERLQAWRWEEVRQVGVANGWLYVNDQRFCPDTGHVRAGELLELAKLDAALRAPKIELLLRRWLRPAHLRRRARVLVGHTATAATLNAFCLVLLAALSAYVVLDAPARLDADIANAVAAKVPLLLGCGLLLHVTAFVTAWISRRRLRVRRKDRRDSALLSALLLPPQALRFRCLMGQDYFPPQHPLALALAFGHHEVRAQWAFQAVADLHWPVHDRSDPPFARQVTAWFGAALQERLASALAAVRVTPEQLLSGPARVEPGSVSYCPRCRGQFVAGRTECPNGVPLRPLRTRQPEKTIEKTLV